MFNFTKDNVEQTTDQLAKKSDQAIQEIAEQVKTSAADLLDAVHDSTEETTDKAKELIRTLKSNIDRLADEGQVANLASQLSERAGRVKDQVRQEVSETYHTLKDKTGETVQQHPLGTVLVAAGVGLLVGYLLGNKHKQ